ncbi:MAG: acetyltransferase-like isoleucine patch superfamily enzyme [Gammaproteobacteria bacterium]|jgi:acetyltransferase-like isoleucine patch superfamily enzyme
MAYYNDNQLRELGFGHVGKNVKVSTLASLYDCDRISLGDNSRIDDFCVVSGKVEIGRYTHITPFCLIAGGSEGVLLEDFTTCAYGVQLFSQSDDYSGKTMTNSQIPGKYKLEIKSQIKIKTHSIIGARSTILPGVTLAEGTAIGAMSLVTRDTVPWGIYIGIPAVRVRNRDKDMKSLTEEFLGCE